MNWMKVALNTLRWKVLALGAVAGLWGSLLHESALLLPPGGPWAPLRALLAGAALGLGLGVLLAPADALLQHYFRRAAKSALAGGVLGALLGGAGTVLHVALLDLAAPIGARWAWAAPTLVAWIGQALTLGLVGGGCGLAAGLVAGNGRLALRKMLLGLLVGTVLAVALAAAVDAVAFDAWILLAGLVLWSGLLALTLHWWGRRWARRWLRLLTGPGEDRIYPLQGAHITLGKNERNDIPLLEFQEIYPYHCELRWVSDHYEIVDNEQGGVVLVNYRQVQEHALRAGDLIKIGSALLQYGEAS
jgi:hypothetical protein